MKYIAPRDEVITEGNPTPPYIDENPAAAISGSVVPAAFFNVLQKEILNVITGEGADLTPDDGNQSQLYEAILALIDTYAAGGGGGGGGPWALAARLIIAGAGLSGGGDLTADRTINLDLSDLTAITALEAADMFGVYDNSAAATRKVSWETMLAGIAVALAQEPGGVPGLGQVGSYVLCGLASGGVVGGGFGTGGDSGGGGGIVAGSALLPSRAGTWRSHGFISMAGVVIDQNSGSSMGGGLGYASFNFGLFQRIA